MIPGCPDSRMPGDMDIRGPGPEVSLCLSLSSFFPPVGSQLLSFVDSVRVYTWVAFDWVRRSLVPQCPDTRVPEDLDTPVPRYPGTRVPGYLAGQICRYFATRIPRFLDSRMSGCSSTQLPEYLGIRVTWASDHPEMDVQEHGYPGALELGYTGTPKPVFGYPAARVSSVSGHLSTTGSYRRANKSLQNPEFVCQVRPPIQTGNWLRMGLRMDVTG